MRLLVFLLAFPLFPIIAQACPVAPFEPTADVRSYNVFGGPGAWLVYDYTLDGKRWTCTVAAPWGVIDLKRLGDRIETIRTASDPKAAFLASWKRHVTLPMSDPSLAVMREAIAASLK